MSETSFPRPVRTTEIIELAAADEHLRQQRETFDQRKEQNRRWFGLRLAMGWTACALLAAIAVVCGWIILDHSEFSAPTVTVATSALLVDILGVFAMVWKFVMVTESPLEPVIDAKKAD